MVSNQAAFAHGAVSEISDTIGVSIPIGHEVGGQMMLFRLMTPTDPGKGYGPKSTKI